MEKSSLNFYAYIELMGHSKIAGFISELKIGNDTLIKVDVPMTKNHVAFTKFFNPNAIYAITPMDEKTCVDFAESIKATPIQVYSLEDAFQKRIQNLIENGQIERKQLPVMIEDNEEDNKEASEEVFPW